MGLRKPIDLLYLVTVAVNCRGEVCISGPLGEQDTLPTPTGTTLEEAVERAKEWLRKASVELTFEPTEVWGRCAVVKYRMADD